MELEKENALAVFEGKKIRKTWHKEEWFFSVIDVIWALTESNNPRRYWSDLKIKLTNEGAYELYDKIVQLKLVSSDRKKYETDCVNTESAFRLIQSIPSPKAEPFKLWLARVGYERVQEIENPELAQNRAKEYYELKGYPKPWIEKRLRGITVRQELTDEWKEREIKGNEFGILTDEIHSAAFDVNTKQHKKIKGLNAKNKNQNLRDHMNDLELIFSMLGEKVATEITKKENSQGMKKCKTSAKRGGTVAKKARIETEKELGKPVVSKENYLHLKEKKKLN
ncbi:MAG: Bro-N domain-containing protein [Candidatus Diapherotrites archaeon]|nr:Bro-N domain-containing protein [Candidatus Diapherotrites archaeon]